MRDLPEADPVRDAAERGEVAAMDEFGRRFLEEGDLAQAEEWFRRAAEGGDVVAMRYLGSLLEDRGDYVSGEAWTRQAAEAGDTDATYNLGASLLERGDIRGAEPWLHRAADAGDSDAMYDLGVLHQRRGDPISSELWYRRAVDAGDADAIEPLRLLLRERGDHEGAEELLHRESPATIRHGVSVEVSEFEELVADALDSLPEDLASKMENIAVLVDTDAPVGKLLGLYQGVPLTSRGARYSAVMPDRITLFMRSICATCSSTDELPAAVRRVVIHEVAHHFGIDDARLSELGWG